MKKQLSLLLAALTLSLSACGGAASWAAEPTAAPTETPDRDRKPAPTETPAESETAATEAAGETAEATDAAGESGFLVAYFSWSGNTEAMANLIAEQTGGTLFEIAPVTPYTDDYGGPAGTGRGCSPRVGRKRRKLGQLRRDLRRLPRLVERCADGDLLLPRKL